MKKKITFLYFTLSSLFVFSQDCDETNNVTLNGEIYDYHLEDCTSNVSINTANGNTNLHGIMLIDAITSINLKATGNNRITIKPNDELDFINLLATSEFKSIFQFIDDNIEAINRTRTGSTDTSAKDPVNTLIYPNPADTILNIRDGENYSYYKILTEYGLTVKEGSIPTNNQLNLTTLTNGRYYLLLQAATEIKVETLYKN